jgi:hypothetical protein
LYVLVQAYTLVTYAYGFLATLLSSMTLENGVDLWAEGEFSGIVGVGVVMVAEANKDYV